jgi:hypothetical protein
MGVLRSVARVALKTTILTVLVAAVSGLAALLKGQSSSTREPVTYDEWPVVPTKPTDA